MSKVKFNVGDVVRGTNGAPYNITAGEDFEGVVVATTDDPRGYNFPIGDDMRVRGEGHGDLAFPVESRYFTLKTRKLTKGDRVEVDHLLYEGTGTIVKFEGAIAGTNGYIIDTDEPNNASRSDGYLFSLEGDLTLIETLKAGDRVYADDDTFYDGYATIVRPEQGVFGTPGYLIDTDGPNPVGGNLWVKDTDVTKVDEPVTGFPIGNKVRLITSNPRHGLGHVSEGDVGEIVMEKESELYGDTIYLVNFPNQNHWHGRPSELQLITEEEAAAAAKEVTESDVIDFLRSKDDTEVLDIVEEARK